MIIIKKKMKCYMYSRNFYPGTQRSKGQSQHV